MSREKIISFEKSFESKISDLSSSIFREITFVLNSFSSDAEKYVTVESIDNVNSVVISNISYYNKINQLGLYNLTFNKKNIILKQSDIKHDLENINKRYKFLSSILISEINRNKLLKSEKILKDMSDYEISETKKLNKIKEATILKLHNKIKFMKVATCI